MQKGDIVIVRNDNDWQLHQLMLERRRMLEEAIDRAEHGAATEEDWWRIRFESGVPIKNILRSE
jgi:hypothetical protein